MQKITAFWKWFADWHKDVASAYVNDDAFWLSDSLTARVKRIERRLNWELGPYHHPENTLVISPSVRENIKLAERIVSAAPKLPGWHFLPAKPAKELNHLQMALPGSAGAEVSGDNWQYRLTSYNRIEFFDIEVFTNADRTIADKELAQLTHRLIESLLGEVIYLERIAAVKILRRDEARPAGATPFPLLGRHMAHLLGGQ